MKKKFHIDGVKEILLKWHKHADLLHSPDPARALYGPPPETVAGERDRDLADFFKQVSLFEDLSQGDLRRLARILHRRTYGDGEYIFEEGNHGMVSLTVLQENTSIVFVIKDNGPGVAAAQMTRYSNRSSRQRTQAPDSG